MKITIIGVGLIGGSMALKLKSAGLVSYVFGVDQNENHLTEAKNLGIIDEISSLENAVSQSELVIIAIPVDAARKILPNITLTPIILKNWFIGDGSSIKQKNCNNHKGQISCKYKNEFILDQFNKLFNKVAIYEYKNSSGAICYTYHISNKNFIKFLDYIEECPVESYKYKWITRCSTTIIETPDLSGEGIV